ncbi:cytidine/deoxycytidylate deaminase-like protein [Branchiibius hedensis]|uniref:Cytidine and deoxycytidylate deaminase zinc-binding region n=2 Tax=Branchiibius hedensis TaxID=672460 RepID=A0A2Y9BTB3_9MICO|nr:cytidine/deoxycytidylate deaminase-like protein [Branchiibius hedensis]SSA33752.1 Cytidine and deoxycytidylate deaminase zinc-binding region [Branchiibius hedensis]
MVPMSALTAIDENLLRQAIELSASAVRHGNHPFGALLADSAGNVLLTAENTVNTDRDVTGHAETNLVRAASRSGLLDNDAARLTLFTSCEPCAMCSAAAYWGGIGRVVFAMAETTLYEVTGAHPENPTLALPSRTVFAAGQRNTVVEGPFLEDVAAVPHAGFWR